MANRVAKLIKVDPGKNNNKFYNMTEENGTIFIEFGRVGASVQKTTKPSSQWDKIYREKTNPKKGYVDQTSLYVVESSDNNNVTTKTSKVRKFTDFLSSRHAKVVEAVRNFQSWAKGSIERNYTVESKDVTQVQVDKAQELINELATFDFNTGQLTDFNKKLVEYFTIVPRRMKKVADHMLKDADSTELDTKRKELIGTEQDTLDVMAGQVKLDAAKVQTVEDEDAPEVETDIIESSGLSFEYVDDKSIIDLIKEKMGPNAHQFKEAFEVRHLSNQKQYDNQVSNAKNKLTDLLWHGSDNANWWSIITTCLQIRPTAAFGRMYGNGVYFASLFQKSYGYSSGRNSYWNKGNSNTAVLALYEVHLGNQKIINRHDSSCYSLDASIMKKEGYDSTHAKAGVSIRNDEFIIYNENQCTIKYLVIVNA